MFVDIKDIGCDGWVTVESFGGQIAEVAAACICHDLAPATEGMAWVGVKLLRANQAWRRVAN